MATERTRSLLDAYRAGRLSCLIEDLHSQNDLLYMSAGEAAVYGAVAIRLADETALNKVMTGVAASLSGQALRDVLEFWAAEAADADQYAVAAHFLWRVYRGGFRDERLAAHLIRWSLQAGQVEGLDDVVSDSLAAYPANCGVIAAVGRYYLARGNKAGSVACGQRLLALSAESIDGFELICDADPACVPDQVLQQFRSAIVDNTTDLRDQSRCGFSLARCLEARSRLAEAWACLETANAAQRRFLDQRGALATIAQLEADWRDGLVMQESLIALDLPHSPLSQRPVFIVGAPRSGTTVLERMLAAHPEGHGAGERGDIQGYAAMLMSGNNVPDLFSQSAETWRTRYMTAAGGPVSGGFIVDKMPANIQFAGLIAALFPDALIIRIVRDKDDNALSLFASNFGFRQSWSTDLDECRDFIALERVMADHWRKALGPNRFLEIVYEDLVRAPAAALDAIMTRLAQAFVPAQLDFHRSGDAVFTLSQMQVRLPLNDNGIGRWSRFAQARSANAL